MTYKSQVAKRYDYDHDSGFMEGMMTSDEHKLARKLARSSDQHDLAQDNASPNASMPRLQASSQHRYEEALLRELAPWSKP